MTRLPARTRFALFGLLLGALVVYENIRGSLDALSTWSGVAFLSFVLVPCVFGLVGLALPLWRSRRLLAGGIVFAAAAVALETLGLHEAADLAKLGATTALAWWFLQWFESALWVAIVALIVPWVDAYSVFRGPTHHIVTKQPHLFDKLSFTFPLPGDDGSAQLGIPDLFFFALFLGTAARFALRPGWTWLCLTASFGATLALTVWLNLAGLPALPGLALGFLLPNADLLWRAARRPRPVSSS
jgi:hypothetical protein